MSDQLPFLGDTLDEAQVDALDRRILTARRHIGRARRLQHPRREPAHRRASPPPEDPGGTAQIVRGGPLTPMAMPNTPRVRPRAGSDRRQASTEYRPRSSPRIRGQADPRSQRGRDHARRQRGKAGHSPQLPEHGCLRLGHRPDRPVLRKGRAHLGFVHIGNNSFAASSRPRPSFGDASHRGRGGRRSAGRSAVERLQRIGHRPRRDATLAPGRGRGSRAQRTLVTASHAACVDAWIPRAICRTRLKFG